MKSNNLQVKILSDFKWNSFGFLPYSQALKIDWNCFFENCNIDDIFYVKLMDGSENDTFFYKDIYIKKNQLIQ